MRSPRSPQLDLLAVHPDEPRGVIVAGDADALFDELDRAELGTVEVALIDPPYNTAGRFHHYVDAQTSANWLAERRRHVEAIHRRLSVTGSLWMHLDDSEMHYCRVMLDEVFGRRNFVATVVWQKSLSRENRTDISTTHEYVLVYAKDHAAWRSRRNLLPLQQEQTDRYRNRDDDPRGPWTSGDLTAKAGPGRRAAQFYDVVTPAGSVVRPAPGMAWRYTRERFDELAADGRVFWGNGRQMPRLKRFLSETAGGLVPTTWWTGREVGTTDTAKKHLRRLFPELLPFETPKPELLVHRVLQIASDPGDLVLDCYGGSGTTAAVAHKMRRRWATCEREGRTMQEFLVPRIERVIAGTDPDGATATAGWTAGGSYAFVTPLPSAAAAA